MRVIANQNIFNHSNEMAIKKGEELDYISMNKIVGIQNY